MRIVCTPLTVPNDEMYKLLCAILFCTVFQPAWAGTGPAGKAPQMVQAAAQVKLVAAADPAVAAGHPAAPATVAGLQDEAAAPQEPDTGHRTDHGILLAALALMAGIVLRRWGAGQR